HAYNATFDPAFQLSDDWPSHLTESFEHAQHQPDTLWALAWDGDEAVGLLIAERHLEAQIFRPRHWIELSALYVRPSHRRPGAARPAGGGGGAGGGPRARVVAGARVRVGAAVRQRRQRGCAGVLRAPGLRADPGDLAQAAPLVGRGRLRVLNDTCCQPVADNT